MRVTYICTATVVRSTALHEFWVVPRLIKGKGAVQKILTFLADMSVKGGRGQNLIHEEFFLNFCSKSVYAIWGGV